MKDKDIGEDDLYGLSSSPGALSILHVSMKGVRVLPHSRASREGTE